MARERIAGWALQDELYNKQREPFQWRGPEGAGTLRGGFKQRRIGLKAGLHFLLMR